MYETFGAGEVGSSGKAYFRVFIPDSTLDAQQYLRGTVPPIKTLRVVGDFQADLGGVDWTPDAAFELTKSKFTDPADGKTKGWLYELTTGALPDGFYQYKLHVTFNSGATRLVCDPCTRYGGAENQNSAFVIGGPKRTTTPLADPLPPSQLVIYELMIDDFTAQFRAGRAPLAAVVDKLAYLKTLGINAIEFMPWTQWAGSAYDWGYTPQDYFAVAYPYTLNPADDAEKLFLLKTLVSRCHELGFHVILDGVFDHVTDDGIDAGFGYRWLWEDPSQSPYCGVFAGAGYGQDLDYANGCTLDYIADVCRYWIDVFAIDGIRFDYTLGFYDSTRPTLGLPALLSRLRTYLAGKGLSEFPLFIEHEWDYSSIGVANKVGATGCWLDPFRGESRQYLSQRWLQTGVVRFLDAALDVAGSAVTYIENHDHESFSLNAAGRDQWWRTQPYAIGLLTAAGTPLIHNGQEYAELYPMPEPGAEGPEGSLDPAVRRILPRPLRWTTTDGPGAATLALYQQLLQLRRTHLGLTSPNFHPSEWNGSDTQPDADGFGINQAQQTVVFHRWGNAADGHLEKFYVVLNFSQNPQTVSLSFPEDGGWIDLLSGWSPPVSGNWLTFQVGGSWGHVFYKKY